MHKVIVIGSVNIDYTIYVDSFPRVGETIHGYNKVSSLGGKGANQALAITRANVENKFLCFLGDDDTSNEIKENFDKYHIDAVPMTIKGVPSGNAFIYVDKDSNNEIIVLSGANFEGSVDVIKKHYDLIQQSEYIVLQNEINPLINEWVIKEFGKTHHIILNPAPGKPLKEELMPYIEYISPNEGELKLITKESDVSKGADYLLSHGVKNVIVTLGEKGSMYFSKERQIKVEPYKVNPIDTVAAGDSFLGFFVSQIASDKDIEYALRFASVGAALSTTKKGAAASIPSYDEIMQCMNKDTK
ncbi:MAG: ribokinase [Bacilli bacterium]|nr:ribokinase [Bacilli bacterium]